MGGQVARSAQVGAKNAQENFSRFVEGPDGRSNYRQVPIDESKRGFWDDFSSIAEQQRQPAGSAIGTAAMGKGNKGPSNANAKDEWDDW